MWCFFWALVFGAAWAEGLVDGLAVLLPVVAADVPEAAFLAVAAPEEEDVFDEELELCEVALCELVVCCVSVDVVVWARASFAKVRPAKMRLQRNVVLAKTKTAERRT